MPTVPEMERIGWEDPGAPGSKEAAEYKSKWIRGFTEGGRTFYVHKDVIPLFRALILMMDKNGVDIDKGVLDDWSYNNRDIRGYPGFKSMHSWGLAIDIDATKNALGSHSTSFPVAKTDKAADDCSLTWGYNWTTRPDPMHFEYRLAHKDIPKSLKKLKAARPLIYARVMNPKR